MTRGDQTFEGSPCTAAVQQEGTDSQMSSARRLINRTRGETGRSERVGEGDDVDRVIPGMRCPEPCR